MTTRMEVEEIKNQSSTSKNDSSSDDEDIEAKEEQRRVLQERKFDISVVDGLLVTEQRFSDLPIDTKLRDSIKQMEIDRMTEIQARSIPLLLLGYNLLGSAKTGMGKTLAFLVPAVDLLIKTNFTHRQGTGVLIITPTRELAIQIQDVAKQLLEGFSQRSGTVMGGANRSSEEESLRKGVNLLVATPGRLLDHLRSVKDIVIDNLMLLIVDEADRLLQIGFEEEMKNIISLLPKKRQTVLFSATQTSNVRKLALVAFPEKPAVVSAVENAPSRGLTKENSATVSTLEQGYVTVNPSERFLLLFTFLKRNEKKKKIIVFFSSRNSVQFHSELFNYINLRVLDIHGKKKQNRRTTVYREFCSLDTGILLATDVAARGLDIPAVDWIVQYDPPDDPNEYIHRVGRTARAGVSGKALLFLMKSELGFLRHLKNSGVSSIQEYEFPTNKLANVQSQLETLVERNFYLHKSATDAYRSYLLAYASHHLKECYDVQSLDLGGLCRSFGLKIPPRVNLLDITSLRTKTREIKRKLAIPNTEVAQLDEKVLERIVTKDDEVAPFRKRKRNAQATGNSRAKFDRTSYKGKRGAISNRQGTHHKFSASNPYGRRDAGDKRQFTM